MLLKKRIEFSGHAGAIYSIDGFENFVFTSSGDSYVGKWNLITGTQENFSIKLNSSVYKIKLIKKNSVLIVGTNDGSIHIFDLNKKIELRHFVQHKSAIFEIQENIYQNHIYTSDSDGNLAVWDSNSFDLLLFIPLDCGKIRHILINTFGEKIYLACQNGEIKIFDTTFFNELTSFKAHENGVNYIILHPAKKNILLSAGKDGNIKAWNILENYKLKIKIPAHNYGIYKLDFFNDNLNLVSISRDKSIKVWNSKSFEVLQKIERKQGGHSHAINSFWKKSDSEFVTVGDDKRIIFWEFENS